MSIHAIAHVLEHSESTLGARLVLIVLADHAKKDGTCSWPSVETIAREGRLSERAVHYALKRLQEDGEVVRTGASKAGTSIWTVRMGVQILQGAVSAGVQNPSSRGARDAPEPSEPSTVKATPSQAASELCEFMADQIAERAGERPKVDARWGRQMDLLLKALTAEEVRAVLGWVHDHNYWSGRVLTPAQLKRHLPAIRSQLRATRLPKSVVERKEQNIQRHLAVIDGG